METVSFYIFPFLKNITILYMTVFLLFLGMAIAKAGVQGFSFAFWLEENRNRFQVGAIFILCLSLLMAVTDVSPLFKFFGFDINASPVGLGLSLGALLGGFSTKSRVSTKKETKARTIQKKAGEIIKESAAIVEEEKGGAAPVAPSKPVRRKKEKK